MTTLLISYEMHAILTFIKTRKFMHKKPGKNQQQSKLKQAILTFTKAQYFMHK